jgi:uncharacterized membrane protein YgaE (UPF0421/DUF939 family)
MKKNLLFVLVLVVVIIVSSFFVLRTALAKSDNSQNGDNEDIINSKQHRSVTADFVKGLLNVADRQKGGIGEQVRVIAQEQGQNEEKTADQIDAIQKRNKIKTFLIGADYKNVGALRSEMVQTRNRIERLKRLMEQTINEVDKAALQTQIDNMEIEQTNTETFLKTNESTFSLFGWVRKLFGAGK